MAYYHVTEPGAGNGDGGTWANAMSYEEFETSAEGGGAQAVAADDTYYVMADAAYVLTSAFTTTTVGTVATPINIIGVKDGTSNEGVNVVLADHGTGATRPTITCAANALTLANYWTIKNFIITITTTTGLSLGLGGIAYNCSVNNAGVATRPAISESSNTAKIIGCELQSGNGYGLEGSLVYIIACYIHDCGVSGIKFNSNTGHIINSIIDTCVIGINIMTRDHVLAIGNTIYGNTAHGIYATTGENCIFLNNIIDANAVGVEWTTPLYCNYFDYNCWDNTDDIVDTDVVMGENAVVADPGMAGPAGGNFSVQAADPVNDAALDAGDLTGATV